MKDDLAMMEDDLPIKIFLAIMDDNLLMMEDYLSMIEEDCGQKLFKCHN